MLDVEFCSIGDKRSIPNSVWNRLSVATFEEEHLLETSAKALQERYETGLSMLGFVEDEVVFHTGLTLLVKWYELGGTWTQKDWRYKGINHKAYTLFLPIHQDKMILTTTTWNVSVRVGEHFGFVQIPRTWLPPEELAATCVCKSHKTRAENPMLCQLAWREKQQKGAKICYVRVTPQTAQAMGWKTAA